MGEGLRLKKDEDERTGASLRMFHTSDRCGDSNFSRISYLRIDESVTTSIDIHDYCSLAELRKRLEAMLKDTGDVDLLDEFHEVDKVLRIARL